jgi:hypothetical protein
MSFYDSWSGHNKNLSPRMLSSSQDKDGQYEEKRTKKFKIWASLLLLPFLIVRAAIAVRAFAA